MKGRPRTLETSWPQHPEPAHQGRGLQLSPFLGQLLPRAAVAQGLRWLWGTRWEPAPCPGFRNTGNATPQPGSGGRASVREEEQPTVWRKSQKSVLCGEPPERNSRREKTSKRRSQVASEVTSVCRMVILLRAENMPVQHRPVRPCQGNPLLSGWASRPPAAWRPCHEAWIHPLPGLRTLLWDLKDHTGPLPLSLPLIPAWKPEGWPTVEQPSCNRQKLKSPSRKGVAARWNRPGPSRHLVATMSLGLPVTEN